MTKKKKTASSVAPGATITSINKGHEIRERRDADSGESYDPLKFVAEATHNLTLRLVYARNLCPDHMGPELFRAVAHAQSVLDELEQQLDYTETLGDDFVEALGQELWERALAEHNERTKRAVISPAHGAAYELAARALGRLEGANNMSITRILVRAFGNPLPMKLEEDGSISREDEEGDGEADLAEYVPSFAAAVARHMTGHTDVPERVLWAHRTWLTVPRQPLVEYNELVDIVNAVGSGKLVVEADEEDEGDDEGDDDGPHDTH